MIRYLLFRSFFICTLISGSAIVMGQMKPGSARWVRSRGSGSILRLAVGEWGLSLHRKDGVDIVFNFYVKDSLGKQVIYIRNADERLLVDDIQWKMDSVLIRLPFFESRFRGKRTKDGGLEGVWEKRLKDGYQSMDMTARPHVESRFPGGSPPRTDISGRWAVEFDDPAKKVPGRLVGEFKAKGSYLTGTFLDPTGDYRFLEGVISGDSMKLSCFDGGHAYYFRARITSGNMLEGQYFSGDTYNIPWKAVRDANAKLPDEFSLTKWKKNSGPLNFSFPDIDGHHVSIRDPRFKGKVVLVQIMGSWCPNCMDETRFLSDLYDRYRDKGVEIVGLAYERSTDFARSARSLRAFQQRFAVKYPLLVTGVTVDDPRKAEKTLPSLEAIVGFPTTIFLDRQGRIAKIHTGFNGPGTGSHYEEQKKEFEEIVDGLL